MEALPRERLLVLAGCDDASLSDLERLQVITPGVTGYAPSEVSRLRLILALRDAGIGVDVLAEGLKRQIFSFEFASQLIFEPVTMSEAAVSVEVTAGQLNLDMLNALRANASLPLQADQLLREDDVEFIQRVAQCTQLGASAAGMERVLRVFGHSVRRCVDTMRDLFRGEVEEPMLNAGLSYHKLLEISAAKRLALQRIGLRILFPLQRRMLEEAVFDNIVGRLHDALREHGLESGDEASLPAVAFAHLSGFAGLTQEIGDVPAAEKAARFEAIAQRLSRSFDGRIIKPLGDGVMMLFPDAASAVEASLSLVEQSRSDELPPVPVGVATGQVVPRDGDIFGRTVNLAARVSALAGPSQTLVCFNTRAAAEASARGLAFQGLGAVSLKGFRDSVPLFSAQRAG
ncbi:adenylate/guanylate cyclase domain-containing protein [Rhizobium sp. BK538]|uniref:adenylate/guanylate cyclase domain-containing protein n=1 Tax=Rhizobium sp. BK538 TaxID=2586984 RepID=UPI001614B218|nr:adenylate/guanylate cyclase domain-containing protein [Rhizobium sp. BK538]MBB4167046.1 class 3 adenylate cyclase [Rhizobium sp. BK538]